MESTAHNWIVRKLLITAVVADEGEAAEENGAAAVLVHVCNLNYRGCVLHSFEPDLIVARLLLKEQFGKASLPPLHVGTLGVF